MAPELAALAIVKDDHIGSDLVDLFEVAYRPPTEPVCGKNLVQSK